MSLYSRFVEEAPAPQRRSKSLGKPRKPNKTLVLEGVEELKKSWKRVDMPHRVVCTQVPELRGNSRSIKSGHKKSITSAMVARATNLRQSLESLKVQRRQKREGEMREIRSQDWCDNQPKSSSSTMMMSDDQPKSSSMSDDQPKSSSSTGETGVSSL